MSHPTTGRELTYEQGNTLLGLCFKEHPQKFGVEGQDGEKFGRDVLGTYDRNARHLLKAIKKISPGFQRRPKMMQVFGKMENWKERAKRTIRMPDGKGGIQEVLAPGQPEETMYDLLEPMATETILVNAYAQDAIESMLVLLSHTQSPYHLSPADQQAIVWDLAEKLEIVPWLEGKIGLKPEKKAAESVDPPPAPGVLPSPATT